MFINLDFNEKLFLITSDVNDELLEKLNREDNLLEVVEPLVSTYFRGNPYEKHIIVENIINYGILFILKNEPNKFRLSYKLLEEIFDKENEQTKLSIIADLNDRLIPIGKDEYNKCIKDHIMAFTKDSEYDLEFLESTEVAEFFMFLLQMNVKFYGGIEESLNENFRFLREL